MAPPARWCYFSLLRTLLRPFPRLHARTYGDDLFLLQQAGRKGLRLLAAGGYFIVAADTFSSGAPPHPLLGRDCPLPRGAAWFGQRSGKPVIPYILVPVRARWELWIGAPVPATMEGVARGLGRCIRHAPGSWSRFVALEWLGMPPSPGAA